MVKKMLLHPQEIETFYILPTIRRYFAIYLKERGLKQKEVAELLGINSATISQYSSEKRGHKVNFNPEIVEEIKKVTKKITDTTSYFRETQNVLRLLREQNVICDVHRQFSPVPKNCDPVKTGCSLEQTSKCKDCKSKFEGKYE